MPGVQAVGVGEQGSRGAVEGGHIGRCVAAGLMKHETVPVGADKLNKMFSCATDQTLVLASAAFVSPQTLHSEVPHYLLISPLLFVTRVAERDFGASVGGRSLAWLRAIKRTHTHTYRVLLEVNVTEGLQQRVGNRFPPRSGFYLPSSLHY